MRAHTQRRKTLRFLWWCLQKSSVADSPLGNRHLNVVAGQERLRGELEQKTVFVRVLRLPRRVFLRLLVLIGQQEVPARLLLRLCEHKCSKGKSVSGETCSRKYTGVGLPLVEKTHALFTVINGKKDNFKEFELNYEVRRETRWWLSQEYISGNKRLKSSIRPIQEKRKRVKYKMW